MLTEPLLGSGLARGGAGLFSSYDTRHERNSPIGPRILVARGYARNGGQREWGAIHTIHSDRPRERARERESYPESTAAGSPVERAIQNSDESPALHRSNYNPLRPISGSCLPCRILRLFNALTHHVRLLGFFSFFCSVSSFHPHHPHPHPYRRPFSPALPVGFLPHLF